VQSAAKSAWSLHPQEEEEEEEGGGVKEEEEEEVCSEVMSPEVRKEGFACVYICDCVCLCDCDYTGSLPHSLTHSLTHSLAPSLTHSLPHSFTHCFTTTYVISQTQKKAGFDEALTSAFSPGPGDVPYQSSSFSASVANFNREEHQLQRLVCRGDQVCVSE
jgi:hypothetical protein